MKCDECGNEMDVTYEDRPYTECGLSNVILLEAEVARCPSCGEEDYVVPQVVPLHRAIAKALVGKKARLAGEEIRFLRKILGWSGEDFARHLGVDAATVSRWENDRIRIGPLADKVLRFYVVNMAPVENYPVDEFADISETKTPAPVTVRVPSRRLQDACLA